MGFDGAASELHQVGPDGVSATTTNPGYRAGIIGAGLIAGVHARAIRSTGGVVAAVAGADAEQSERAAREMGALRAAVDAQDVLADPDVEVVHICTPNYLHVPFALAAIAAGKHVVCEKPLAMDVAGAEQVVAAAAAAGVTGVVPFAYRFHPMVREARELVRSGRTGPIHLVHGSYLQDWLLNTTDTNWRVDPQLGGRMRAFSDIGTHLCDLIEFTSGQRIVRVLASSKIANPRRVAADGSTEVVRTEDIVTFQFELDQGALGAAVVSQVSAGRKNRLFLEVSGSRSTLAFDQELPELLWEGRRETSQLRVRDPQTLSAAALRYSRLPAGHAQGYQECFDSLVADTASAVAGTVRDGLPTFVDGLRMARVTDAVERSVATRSWVEVG